MTIRFDLNRILLVAITSLLFFACKKEDKKKTIKDSLIGTWESSSVGVRRTSKGIILFDSITRNLSPTDYIFTFKEDKKYELIANVIDPIKFTFTSETGTYNTDINFSGTGDGNINTKTTKDGKDEYRAMPYYLSGDKLSIALIWSFDTSVSNEELLLHFNRKK